MVSLQGKVAFITGAAQGLGKAYAEALLPRGVKVFLGDINVTALNATFRDFQARFGPENVGSQPFDVTDQQQFKDAFNSAVSTFGQVDIVVNNAGILDESKWELQININFTALVFGTKLAVEHMRKDKGGKGGRIINISSVTGLGNFFIMPVYSATKHAVRAYTAALAEEPDLDVKGIEFSVLCPDAAATELLLSIDDVKVVYLPEAKKRLHADVLPLCSVVDAFMELVQLERMNGAILLVTPKGKTYQRVESHAVEGPSSSKSHNGMRTISNTA